MRIKDFIFLQSAVLIYSLGSICSKFASKEDFLSFRYILFMGLMVASLGIYAILYQQILKKTSLSVAFANKGTTVIWSIILGYFIFKEEVTVFNIIGAVIVLIGIIVMSKDGKADE